MSSKDSNKTRTMHSKSNNIEIWIRNKTNEIIDESFDSLLQKYQKRLEESMEGSKFVFDKISLNRGGSYISSILTTKKQLKRSKTKKVKKAKLLC